MTDMLPLRPSDLVYPNKQRRSILNVEETLDTLPLPTTQASLLEDWMKLSSLSQSFISRWNTEYLQMLQDRHQVKHQQSHLNQRKVPRVGEIVLIDESGKFGMKRTQWPLAKVVEVDSRSAKLFNSRTKQVVERPFRSIVPLEIDSVAEQEKEKQAESKHNVPTDSHATAGSVAQRTRSRTVHTISTTVMMMIGLICLSTASSLPVESNKSVDTRIKSNGSEITIEDISERASSILREITERLGYYIAFIGVISIVYCISIVLHVSSFLAPIFIGFWKVFRICIKGIFCQLLTPSRTLTRTGRTTLMVVLMLYQTVEVFPCTEVAHINAKETVCYLKDQSQDCVINSVSIVNLKTMGSTSCLQFFVPAPSPVLKGTEKKEEMIFTLKIEAEAILLSCNKHVVFFSRDHKLNFEFSRRCDSAGSCSIERCSQIQSDENLPELSNMAKNSPGYTSCTAGCGCINCGCFYCDPSCLFFRYYAQPTNMDLYEVSQCSSWTPSLRTKITINNNSTMRHILRLGVKFQIPGTNISITAINLNSPPMPTQQSTFVTSYSGSSINWMSFTHVQPSAPGVPTRGLVGEFQCATKTDAEAFKCKFDPSLCRCVGFATKVSCNCQKTSMSDYKKQNTLPFKDQSHVIRFDGTSKRIMIESFHDSIVALQVEAVNATVNRHTTIAKCFAHQVTPLQGCHSCSKSAATTIACQSTKSTKALLTCPDYTSSIDCNTHSPSTELQIAVSSSSPQETLVVEWNCTVLCGIPTFILIKGELKYEPSFRSVNQYAAQVFEGIAEVPSIFGSISRWFYDVMFEKIFGIGLVLVLIVVVCSDIKCFFWATLAVYAPAAVLTVGSTRRQRRRQKIL